MTDDDLLMTALSALPAEVVERHWLDVGYFVEHLRDLARRDIDEFERARMKACIEHGVTVLDWLRSRAGRIVQVNR